jgi:DNA-binding CsgD family transcriptional regulator
MVSLRQKGIELLQKSLDIAIKNSYEEHAARADTNLGANAVEIKDYVFAKKMLEEGIRYCEERDLDSWTTYILSYKARILLETGHWNEAFSLGDHLIRNSDLRPISRIGALVVVATIKMRKGESDFLPLLFEARTKALETMEAQRIIPALVALMECEWLTGTNIIKKGDLDLALALLERTPRNYYENSEFDLWLFKTIKQHPHLIESRGARKIFDKTSALKAAAVWKQLGCPYEQALALFEGGEADKKEAIEIVHRLGATAAYERMKFEMRALGIKSIPRGMRRSTKSNPANLTTREIDVLQLLKEGLQNKEIGEKLFISPKTVDHHISSIFFKLDVNSRNKAVQEATRQSIIK